MSQGFSKWSNNDNSDPNIRAVRFGFRKPILEAELNELQDLNFISNAHLNRVMFNPNTYSSPAGSFLVWEYSLSIDTLVASLVLEATSLDDVIALNFSGGIVYYYTPKKLGRQTLVSVELPLNAPLGSKFTLVCKAKIKTLSPDFSDDDYDDRVAFAIDPRYPSLVTTKRVAIESGFDGTHSEIYFEDFNTVYNALSAHKVTGLNSNEESYIILGSWERDSTGISPSGYIDTGALRKVVSTIEESKSSLITDCQTTYGTYSMTPVDSRGVQGYELRIDFPIKSIRFGYYALMENNTYYQGVVKPVNQPTIIASLGVAEYKIALFSLEDLINEKDKAWESLYSDDRSWEDLLNQKWFDTDIYGLTSTPAPTLTLRLKPTTVLNGVEFGSLEIEWKGDM